MSYTVEYAEDIKKSDEVVEDKGVKVLVDPKAVLFLLGTEMDFKIDKMAATFVFNNPNQTGACGCGESVQLTPPLRANSEIALMDLAMDAEAIAELFAAFGAVDVRRMFSGFGLYSEASVRDLPRGVIYLKADENVAALRAEGCSASATRRASDGRDQSVADAGTALRRSGGTRRLGAQAGARAARRKKAAGEAARRGEKQEKDSKAAVRRPATAGRLVFGIGLADHAVAAVALGRIEAGVGALDQRIRVVARRQRGNAGRDRDAAEDLAGRLLLQFLRHHGATDVVGDGERLAQRRVRQHARRIPRRRSAR